MPKKKIINLFVSHYHEDADELSKLRNLLGKKGYSVRDSSIDERNPNKANNEEYIKRKILAPRIERSGTMIVVVGPNTSSSEWVDWEIKYAKRFQEKRIIGVYLHGGRDSDVPMGLNKYGDALIAWNSDKLDRAITGEDIWNKPDETPRDIFWHMNRSEC